MPPRKALRAGCDVLAGGPGKTAYLRSKPDRDSRCLPDTPVFAMTYAPKMGILQTKRSQSHHRQNAVRFRAATAELDLAITFYLVAAATKDQDRSDRAIAHAKQAYAIAAASLDCRLRAGQNLEIEEKLMRLNSVRSGCPPNAIFVPQ